MAVFVPAIAGFDSAPQSSMQYIMVPSIPTYNPSEMYYSPNSQMWGAAFANPCVFSYAAYGETFGSDTTQGEPQEKVQDDPNKWTSGWNKVVAGGCPVAAADDSFDVSVVLSNLPKMLSSESCLAAAFEQARVEDSVRFYSVKQHGKGGEAIVILYDELAAQKVLKHFQNMRCGRSPQKIIGRYCSEAGRHLMMRLKLERAELEEKPKETGDHPKTDSPTGIDVMSKQGGHVSRVAALPLTKISMKKRWADYVDEDDIDGEIEDDTQSTVEGSASSTCGSAEMSSSEDL